MTTTYDGKPIEHVCNAPMPREPRWEQGEIQIGSRIVFGTPVGRALTQGVVTGFRHPYYLVDDPALDTPEFVHPSEIVGLLPPRHESREALELWLVDD